MNMRLIGRGALALAGAMGWAAATPALAQERGPGAPTSAPATSAAGDAAFAAPAVDDAGLNRETGREDLATMVASANQRNTVSGNSVIGTSATGNIAIDGNAFQNLQGLAVISANSGNNVAINSAMNVTVSLGTR